MLELRVNKDERDVFIFSHFWRWLRTQLLGWIGQVILGKVNVLYLLGNSFGNTPRLPWWNAGNRKFQRCPLKRVWVCCGVSRGVSSLPPYLASILGWLRRAFSDPGGVCCTPGVMVTSSAWLVWGTEPGWSASLCASFSTQKRRCFCGSHWNKKFRRCAIILAAACTEFGLTIASVRQWWWLRMFLLPLTSPSMEQCCQLLRNWSILAQTRQQITALMLNWIPGSVVPQQLLGIFSLVFGITATFLSK